MTLKLPLKEPVFLSVFLSAIVVIALEVLSLAGHEIPFPYAPVVYGLFILVIGRDILWSALKNLVKFKFNKVSVLMFIAVTAAFYLKEYSEAAVVMVLYVLGEALEDVGMDNSKSAMDALISRSPKTAFSKESGEEIPVNDVPVGMVLIIKPGQMVPMDGIIINGDSNLDEAAITGEPIARHKQTGDTVYAGTMNQNGTLEIRTTQKSADTVFSKIIQLTFEANAHKSERQKFIQKFAGYYTPAILAGALLLFAIPVLLGHDAHRALQQAISLLVISCPCALIISTPIAIFSALGNASSKGIIVKGGKYIEAMAAIKAIAFDKTRTITYGKPVVSDVIVLNGTSREELLACTAGAEAMSEHPLAQAIVAASHREGHLPHIVKNYKTIIGKGATAECLICKNEIIQAGTLDFIGEKEQIQAEEKALVAQFSKEGKSSIVVSFGKGVAGVFGLTDEVKQESIAAIKALKALGIKTIMLSGDSQAAANHVARQAGMDAAFGGLLPDEKSARIKELLHEYHDVAMVGDGVNDAPALALSTVGIAMGAAGSDIAIDSANIALLNDNPDMIPYLVQLSRATVKQIKSNIILTLIVKAAFITLSLIGYSSLVLAIIADVGVTLVVILLSLRLMNFRQS